MQARLVWDEKGDPIVPEEMMPKDISKIKEKCQLQGTPREKLCEIAGRVCYDSIGSGRSSGEYHKHIIEVGHLSTVEHAYFTCNIELYEDFMLDVLKVLMNRPGLFCCIVDNKNLRITTNIRTVLDWEKWNPITNQASYKGYDVGLAIQSVLQHYAKELVPQIVSHIEVPFIPIIIDHWLVEPDHLMEKHISLFMSGSRGFSHELVRHRFNISQRSTRYCNESESDWIWHPLVNEYDKSMMGDKSSGVISGIDELCISKLNEAKEICARTYDGVVSKLEQWLISRGVDKFTSRKQARGAARGVLGNALNTEMIFTASVAMWRWMLDLRASAAADAEIRVIFCKALEALKSSQYKADFDDYILFPSPDGIGQIARKIM